MGDRRKIIGMDIPGGFSQLLRLGPEALEADVFPVPEELPAAAIALLEPYGCVERAYRPNVRVSFAPAGRALVVLGRNAARYTASLTPAWAETTLADLGSDGQPDFIADRALPAATVLPEGETFDDILALGELDAATLGTLFGRLARGGLMLIARQEPADLVPIDPARVHYEQLSILGTSEADIAAAFEPAARRFDVRHCGTALVNGAAGAMGRIHLHRLLQLDQGPRTVIATARSPRRLAELERDFAPMAAAAGRDLVLIPGDALGETVARLSPEGVDDAVVVAPSADAVRSAVAVLAPHGLLAVFAGFPFGDTVPFDLAAVALAGKRLTGSTGCGVADMKDVLARVLAGELDLVANVKAVGGLEALPAALLAVNGGEISGKIVIFPQVPDLALCRVENGWTKDDEAGLTAPAEADAGALVANSWTTGGPAPRALGSAPCRSDD